MIKKAVLTIFALVTFTGCMGTNGLSGKVVKWNLEASEDRWNREWIFLGLWICLVYPISGLLDILVFNSIEFWTGENPINGKSPLVDLPMEAVKKMGFHNIDKAQIERLNANNAKLHLDFENGDKATFDVLRDEMNYTVSYRGVEFYKGNIAE
jgi:hypothetical protein